MRSSASVICLVVSGLSCTMTGAPVPPLWAKLLRTEIDPPDPAPMTNVRTLGSVVDAGLTYIAEIVSWLRGSQSLGTPSVAKTTMVGRVGCAIAHSLACCKAPPSAGAVGVVLEG